MQRNDSIHTEIQQQETFIEESEMLMQNSNAYGKKLHPYQVLRTLPKDATPAQQDSAIQAAFQPAEIRYSSRPDTLRLPGQPLGKRASDVSLPQYYRETFFKTDSLFHPELNGGRMGMAGNPLPYRASNDDFVTGLLLMLLVITILTVSRSLRFITTQAKNFLYQERRDSVEVKETINEVNYQFFLCLQAGVLLTLVFHNYSLEAIGETYVCQTTHCSAFTSPSCAPISSYRRDCANGSTGLSSTHTRTARRQCRNCLSQPWKELYFCPLCCSTPISV